MSAKMWISELLRRENIEFREVKHPTAFTAQELAHSEHVSGHRVAKVVVVFADGKPMMLVLPASRRVLLSSLQELTNSEEIHLASEADMSLLFPDCEVGAEPPLRHGEKMPVWMDESMQVEGEFVFSGGTHRDGIHMDFKDWFDLVDPRVESFTVEPGRFPPRPVESR